MKTIGTIILTIFLLCNLVAAQDTLYIYKSGIVVTKRAVNDIDSVIFYKPNTPPAVITDIVGNIYHTVNIGTQIWMVENLKTTKYNDGTSIPLVSDGTAWTNLTTPGYCFYNNDAANKTIYGVLYNWYTVNTSKLAPTGWHVPSDAEWTTLENYLIANGYNYDGTTTGNKIAKSLAATTLWNTYTSVGAIGDDLTKNNTSGFAGHPGGYRTNIGNFYTIGFNGHWWSSSQINTGFAWYRYLSCNYSYVSRDYYGNKQYGFSVRCVKDYLALPTINTSITSSITLTSATSGGNITYDGGATVLARGVCWSTTSTPTTANSKTSDGSGTGAYTSSITGLTASTTYYVRAYATNSVGTSYGNEVSFTTNAEVTVTDIDGNIYHTVNIGTQTWMVENLKTTKYNDGTSMPLVSDGTAWSNLTTPGYCFYNNDVANKTTYGALYNWYTVNTGKLAPKGWHIPSDAEWTMLENYLIANGYNYDGTTTGNKIAKSLAATNLWITVTTVGTIGNGLSKNNTSGFAGLPGGGRYSNGQFNGIGYSGLWWSSTQSSTTLSMARYLDSRYSNLISDNYGKLYGFSVRCVQDSITVPTINTTITSSVTLTSATSGGNITYDGGATILARGVCWSITSTPTTANSKTSDGSGTGAYTSSITGLTASTTYYVRAYATNSVSTSYGNEVSFTTNAEVTVTDIDGNIYNTVNIGTQTWMVENLKTTKYNDGTSIPLVSDGTAWTNLSTPGYCFYDNDAANKSTYGALYNWYTVNTGKLAPTGWHVPTDAEWTTLENYLIANGYNYDGTTTGNKIAKSLAATTLWYTDTTVGVTGNDLIKNNTSGFAGLPGGYRFSSGTFGYISGGGDWWSSSQNSTSYAWNRYLGCHSSGVDRNVDSKQYGFSVRCVRD